MVVIVPGKPSLAGVLKYKLLSPPLTHILPDFSVLCFLLFTVGINCSQACNMFFFLED